MQPVEGISGVLIALLSSVPFGTAAAAMVIVARRSAAVGEQPRSLLWPCLLTCCGHPCYA